MVIASYAAMLSLALGQRTPPQVAPGSMEMFSQGRTVGFCPLQNTSVKGRIDGFGAEVTVVQKFKNTSTTPIEAVYTFPLPADAAVGRMRIRIGDRVIEGQIKKREEARQIYEAAKREGKAAALLDQERPNIFTQSVANITPGSTIEVEITYVQVMKYVDGEFEFNFPMTVGPRYMNGATPDPTKIDPPRGTRVGTNVDLTLEIHPGGEIRGLHSVLHEIDREGLSGGGMRIKLKKEDEIPNRDFIVRYALSGSTMDTAFLTHNDGMNGGYFSLVVLPPKRPTERQIAPREMVFVMDQSGSQEGFPIEKSKELTLKMFQTLRPNDTFNVMGFNNGVTKLWPEPKPVTAENLKAAREFVSVMKANGGTELGEGMRQAMADQNDPNRLRMIVFNTDGLIGSEAQVYKIIQQNRNRARLFTFGIGNGVNRYLIDVMAEEGRGDAEYVTLAEQADAAVTRFWKKTNTPVLTDVTASFSGATVSEIQPGALPDVFSDRPIVIYGRYTGSGPGKVVLRGNLGGQPWSKTVDLDFTARSSAPAIPVLWARKKVAETERMAYLAPFLGRQADTAQATITDLGLRYGIMTQYTSFVAVEQKVINVDGKQRTVQVPVEQTDGVTFADKSKDVFANRSLNFASGGGGGGIGGGGFGAGGAGRGSGAPPATVSGGIKYIAGDPSDNSIVLKPGDRRKNMQAFIDAKVDKKLKDKKGTLEVQIIVAKLDQKTLDLLKAKGAKIVGTEAGHRVVFAKITDKVLGELAILDEVLGIRPL